MQQACDSLGRAEVCVTATVDVMMTALNSHDRFPRSVSDTLPGFRFNRLPISACER
jgi:hypothetical protein